ncbi:vWA domain-containing protein [Arenimonas fontis]|uniref:VWA domain-containing protein n=1 Tax=Arenimonas fontis TaxID=2608255 RepID=A0A5B2ZBK7_9GAMM|nr:VWA domain-containing protein [Arenimonas fontis]KAA2285516.1 VWA domain-containing protein [Arenimonas fontis]
MSRIRPTLLAAALAFALGAGCTRPSETRMEAEADAPVKAKAEHHRRAEAAAESERLAVAADGLPSSQPLYAPSAPPPTGAAPAAPVLRTPVPEVNTENYARFEDNGIVRTAENPVSTFSIDVDTGSYSNVRRMLNAGRLPPKDAVRVEEMLNYFDYAYPAPDSREQPFASRVELAPAPWNPRRLLMQVGLKGYSVPAAEIPAANLVFLVDTSGSMYSDDKLPLLKQAFAQLVPRLRAQDRVSIVAYAGSAGLVLPPTPGDRHGEILDALNRLEAGGSTNGGEGIELAYAVAKQAFIENGVNRILLASDGDFNVGIRDPRALETRIEAGRESGVAFSVLGFGGGNYNDALAERLADAGNGNYAYTDNLMEARKVLVEEMGSTLLTIAGDVKVQVEFNPSTVAEYRLIGYENRTLAREDFNNDRVDAGEIGAGHDVTALYEICLLGMGCDSSDPLRYGKVPATAPHADELAYLKLRYKLPGDEHSVLMEQPVRRSQVRDTASGDLRFAAAVVAFADLLRGGGNTGDFDWARVEALARDARGDDPWGHRGEFLQLVGMARSLSEARQPGIAAIHEE